MSRQSRASIALIELTGGDNLRAALNHLQQAGLGMNIHVICRGMAPDLLKIPGVHVIEDAGATIPARRLSALRHARSEWVVLLEDTSLVTPDWVATLPGLLDDPNAGGFWGPVRSAAELPARFRALGIMEYGRFSTFQPGAATMPGNCMILRRAEALKAVAPPGAGIVEHALVPKLATAGWPVRFNSSLISIYAHKDLHGARLTTRFSHGRLYAANRYGRKDRRANFKGAARAVLVPLVLSLRAARYLAVQSRLVQIPPTMVWVVLMSVAWAAGEIVGHLAGEGRSKESWS